MIRVTRLDRQEIVLNCDLIESIEARPDTTIRLVTGASLVVRDGVDEIVEAVRTWRAGVLERAGAAGLLTHPSPSALLALLARTEGEREAELEFGSDRADLEIPA